MCAIIPAATSISFRSLSRSSPSAHPLPLIPSLSCARGVRPAIDYVPDKERPLLSLVIFTLRPFVMSSLRPFVMSSLRPFVMTILLFSFQGNPIARFLHVLARCVGGLPLRCPISAIGRVSMYRLALYELARPIHAKCGCSPCGA